MNRPVNQSVLFGGISVLAVTLLLVGCASIRGTVPDASIVAEASCAHLDAAGRMPADFEPVSVMLCDGIGTAVDDTSAWAGPATRHLHGNLDPLVDALNQPDDPRWPGPCTAMMVIVPQLWLADADRRAVHVTYPVDGCGQPKTEAVNAALALLEGQP